MEDGVLRSTPCGQVAEGPGELAGDVDEEEPITGREVQTAMARQFQPWLNQYLPPV